MSQIKSVPDQIRFYIKFYMAELELDVNDFFTWAPGMKEVVKKVHELSPVTYNVQAIARVTGRSEAAIYRALASQPVGV